MKRIVSLKIYRFLDKLYDGLMNFSETTFPNLIDATVGRLMENIGKPYQDEIDEDYSIDMQIKTL